MTRTGVRSVVMNSGVVSETVVAPSGVEPKRTANSLLALSIAVEALVRMEKGVTLGATTFALPPGSQEIIIAVAMILVLIFRPAGLMAGREIMLPARWVAGRHSTKN